MVGRVAPVILTAPACSVPALVAGRAARLVGRCPGEEPSPASLVAETIPPPEPNTVRLMAVRRGVAPDMVVGKRVRAGTTAVAPAPLVRVAVVVGFPGRTRPIEVAATGRLLVAEPVRRPPVTGCPPEMVRRVLEGVRSGPPVGPTVEPTLGVLLPTPLPLLHVRPAAVRSGERVATTPPVVATAPSSAGTGSPPATTTGAVAMTCACSPFVRVARRVPLPRPRPRRVTAAVITVPAPTRARPAPAAPVIVPATPGPALHVVGVRLTTPGGRQEPAGPHATPAGAPSAGTNPAAAARAGRAAAGA